MLYDSTGNPVSSGGNVNMNVTGSDIVTEMYTNADSVKFSVNPLDMSITLKLDTRWSLNRIMYTAMGSGNVIGNAIAGMITAGDSYVIPSGKSLVLNLTTNSSELTDGVSIGTKKCLIAYNNNGRITAGLLQPIFARHYPIFADNIYKVKPREVKRHNGANYKSFHCLYTIGDVLYSIEVGNGDGDGLNSYDLTKIDTDNLPLISNRPLGFFDTSVIEGKGTYAPRCVMCDYSDDNEALIMGNSSTDGDDNNYMRGFIFYDAKNWMSGTSTLNFGTCGDYTKISFIDFFEPYRSTMHGGLANCKMIWDRASKDCCYLTNNGYAWYRILLGRGTNRLDNGDYTARQDSKFNGTWKLIESNITFYNDYMTKDACWHNGSIFHPIKKNDGGFYIQEDCLSDLMYDNAVRYNRYVWDERNSTGDFAVKGSPEGIVSYKGKVISAWAGSSPFYVFDI